MQGKKKFDIKGLFANHIEKIGFGLIALIVFGVWSSEFFGGGWSRTKESPDAIIGDIEKKQKEIETSLWPEDKKAEFALVDFSQRAETLLRPIDSSKYELSTEYFVPLNRPKEKAREPERVAVETLIAHSGHVILAFYPEEEPEEEESEEKEATPSEMEEEDDEFARRDVATGGGTEQIEDEIPLTGRSRPPKGRKVVITGPGAQTTGGAALAGQMKSERMMGERGGKNSRTISGQKPQGRFYVAVRGVWPIKQQLERIKNALHLPTLSAALDHMEILDFELERQVATAGDDPWSKDWEKLNIMYAKQVLDEVDGFDDEPTQMQVFDTVITMPLPMRMFGHWKDHALHPRIKNYVLTPEEQQKEKAFQARIMEEYEKMQLAEEKARGPKRGGFDSQSNDFGSIVSDMSRANPKAANAAFGMISREMQGGGLAGIKSPADFAARITAERRLLLFRYFDFDVQPGYAYRYRVKLKLLNPNYERSLAEVVDPSVVEEEHLWTPESNISNPAVLDPSPVYFLKDVEKNPLADDGRKKQTVASVAIYEWHKQLGTQVYDTLPLISLGQFLGGKSKPMVLNVSAPSLDNDEYLFSTEDVLLDVNGDTELDPVNHPFLALPERRKGAKVVALGLAPEAMVIDAGGELRYLESDGETDAERKLKKLAERERARYKDLPKQDESANALDLLAGKGAGAAMPPPGGRANVADDGGAAAANPRRKGKKDKGNAARAAAGPAGGGYVPAFGSGGNGPNAPAATKGAKKPKGKN